MSEKYAPEVGDFKKTSQWKTTFRRLCRNRGAVIGMVILFIILMMALFADLLFDYETMVEANNIPERLLAPCWAHPFGTDQFGRDMLARVVHGSRISLAVSASSVTFSLVVGGILGAISGYFGGWVDNIIMRVMDVVMAIPMTMFAIVIVAALGTSTANLILALGIASVPLFARVVRSAVLTVRDTEYIEAARAVGAKNSTIIFKHIIPNCVAPIIVQVGQYFTMLTALRVEAVDPLIGKTHGHHIVALVRRTFIENGHQQFIKDHPNIFLIRYRVILDDLLQYKRMFRMQKFHKAKEQEDISLVFVIVHPATSKEDASSGLKDRSRSCPSDKPHDPAP